MCRAKKHAGQKVGQSQGCIRATTSMPVSSFVALPCTTELCNCASFPMPTIVVTQHPVLQISGRVLAPGHICYRLRKVPNCKSVCFAMNPCGIGFAQQLQHSCASQRWQSWSKPGSAALFQGMGVDSRTTRNRTREEFGGRDSGPVGNSSAVHTGAKGFDSKLAMRKSEVDSCSWLRPSEEEGPRVPLLDSLIQSPRGNGAGEVEDGKFSRNNLQDSFLSFEQTSNGAATDSSFQSLNSSKSSSLVAILENSPSSHGANARIQKAEAAIERAIINSRFLSLLAVAGSLAGSLLCFLKGCFLIYESYVAYYTMCLKGVHTGKVVIQVVEAVDIYLTGTAMLIFGIGLYGLFISNIPDNLHPSEDRALQVSSMFGMFILKKRPKWMQITSLDILKRKLGHVIIMILLVKMFEGSKAVIVTSGVELLMYSVSILLLSSSLFVLHKLHH